MDVDNNHFCSPDIYGTGRKKHFSLQFILLFMDTTKLMLRKKYEHI
jgi:hypothetical protein